MVKSKHEFSNDSKIKPRKEGFKIDRPRRCSPARWEMLTTSILTDRIRVPMLTRMLSAKCHLSRGVNVGDQGRPICCSTNVCSVNASDTTLIQHNKY